MRYSSSSTFSEQIIDAVWQKAKPILGYPPTIWRSDMCGKIIKRNDYGSTTSDYGWEIDHIKPLAKGGSDLLFNLQPLQWQNNKLKSDEYPCWYCAVGQSKGSMVCAY